MLFQARSLRSAGLLAGLFLAACPGEDPNDPGNPIPSITLTVGTTAVTITQGGSGEIAVTIARNGGYTGAVNVAVEGLPAGVTAQALSIGTGQNSGVITLNAASGAAIGAATLTIRATGTSVSAQTGTAALTVAVRGSYTLSLAPNSVSMAAGGSAEVTVAIGRVDDFGGAVALSATPPAGITVGFAPASATGAEATATVGVAAGVAAGNYSVGVRGVTPGLADQTVTLQVTVTEPAGFSLAVAPTPLAVVAGGSADATVTIARTGGFAGEVELTATVPAGVSAQFTPASVAGTTSTMHIGVDAGTAAGNYTVTVRGTAAGHDEQTAILTVAVGAAGSFTLSLAPSVVSIEAGAGGSSTVTINRTDGFDESVALTATVPAGLSASFTPSSTTATTATLQVDVAGGVAAGSYPLTVRGNAAGVAEQTAELTVTVTTPAPGGGNVTWTFCEATRIPLWVAAQDAGGAWTRVTGAGDSYSFQIDGGRGGIAYLLPWQTGGFDLEVFYGTTAELQAVGGELCAAAGALKTVNASVSGVGLTDMAQVTLGNATNTIAAGAPTSFELTDVIPGPVDLLASRSTLTIVGVNASFIPNRFVVRRGLNPPAGGTVPVVDFATEGAAPLTATTTLTNLGGDAAVQVMSYRTINNTFGTLWVDGAPAPAASRTLWGMPAAQQAAGDFHFLNVNASPSGGGGGVPAYTRNVGLIFQAAADQTVTFGPLHSVPVVGTAAGAGYGRITASFAIQPEYDRYHVADYQQTPSGTERRTQVQKTKGYIGAGGPGDLDIPDLSGVAGWLATWGLVPGVSTIWTIASSGWSDLGGVVFTPWVDGTTFISATRSGSITP